MPDPDFNDKETALQEIKRRSRTLRLMRNVDNMSDFGLLMTDIATKFGDTDPRFVEAREAVKNEPKVLKAILEQVYLTLAANKSPEGCETVSAMYRTFYPETDANAAQHEILGMAVEKLQGIANKTDISKH